MIESLRRIHLSRLQMAIVTLASAAATAAIIVTALSQGAGLSSAMLAALAHRRTAVQAGSGGASALGTSGSSLTPAAGGPPGPVITTPTPASNAQNGSGDQSSAAGGGGASTGGGGRGGEGGGGHRQGKGKGKNTHPKSKVGHVFVIALSTPSFDATWGPGSVATYLNKTLRPAGTFLGGYETLGAAELPDYLALVSGQAPNPDTEGDCSTYAEFRSGTAPSKSGQVPGSGCIYPNSIITIADQVTAAGQTWRGYIEDQNSPCLHANSNAVDNAPLAGAGPEYDTRHNPFIYFHSLLDLGGCAINDVSLTDLPKDLKSLRTSPVYSFISPGACDDGSAQSCPGGKPGGLAGEDAFLRQWVPVIEKSAAYKKDGVIVIVFALSGTGTGGSAPVGALVLSRFAARGKAISPVFNPYSILRGTEDLLGYTPLVNATRAKSFVTDALPGA